MTTAARLQRIVAAHPEVFRPLSYRAAAQMAAIQDEFWANRESHERRHELRVVVHMLDALKQQHPTIPRAA